MATSKKNLKAEYETDATGKYQLLVLPIEDIETSIQLRFRINPETVSSYALAMKNGAVFPDIVCFCPEGAYRYILADGHHRLEAHMALKKKDITVRLYVGDYEEALKYALVANATNGLQLTAADKRKIVMTVLSNEQYAGLSLRDIGDLCRVSHELVRQCKQELIEREQTIAEREEKKGKEEKPVKENSVRSQAAADKRTLRELLRGFAPLLNNYEPKTFAEHVELDVADVEDMRRVVAWVKKVSDQYE